MAGLFVIMAFRPVSAVNLRVGRFLADLNAPTMAIAERLARRLADLLSGG